MNRFLALATALVLGLLVAVWGSRPPAAVTAAAPAAVFSAERAFTDINFMGAEPRPIESLRHGVVRDYLIDRMKKLGLEVRVQKGQAVEERTYNGQTFAEGAYVENLIGVWPGADRSAKSLALMAHYDGVPGSPAAADDAAGVSSGLEVIRALKASGKTPARDVDLILTDGEENGLIGARAFFADDPLAKQIGAVINMEARGSGGRTVMFETAKNNGAMVNLFQRTGVNPTGNSLAVFIYEHMPNDTDFTVSKKLGIQGLNFAFIGRQFDYHSPSAVPAVTEPGSIQHMGDQVLSAARALAFDKTLPGAAPDQVFSDVLGLKVVAYPPVIGWVILAAALALAIFAVLRLKKDDEAFSWVDLAKADAAAFALILFLAALFSLARSATGVHFGFVQAGPLLARFTLFEAALGALGLGAVLFMVGGLTSGLRRLWVVGLLVVIGALVWVHGWAAGAGLAAAAAFLAYFAYGKPMSPLSVIGGFLAAAFGLGIIAQALAAPAAFVFAWPLLLVSLALAVSALAGGLDKPVALVALTLAGVLGLGWGLSQFHFIALGIGADLPQATSIFIWLAAIVAIPLFALVPRGPVLGMASLVVGVALTLTITLQRGDFTPRHPRATEVLYVHDADTGKYWRVSLMDHLDPWTEQVLKADGGKIEKRLMFPLSDRPVYAAEGPPGQAPRVNQPYILQPGFASILHGDFPIMMVHRDGAATKSISIDAASVRPSRLLLALRSSRSVPTIQVSDHPSTILSKPNSWGKLIWASPQEEGVDIEIETSGHGDLEFRYAVIHPGWPSDAKPLPPRPKNDMAWSLSDSTVEIGTIKQSW
jgi:hypothetical protein